MRDEHKTISKEIKAKWSEKYQVFTEATDGRIYLPNRKLHVYGKVLSNQPTEKS